MPPHKGILLINTGSPSSPDKSSVADYLAEFLDDPYIVDLPSFVRKLLVNFVIVPGRAASSAEKYAKIFRDGRSPLVIETEKLARALEDRHALPVAFGMRYGAPSIAEALCRLKDRGAEEITAVPLYPQYADATWRSAMEAARAAEDELGLGARITFIEPYYDDPAFITALCESARPFLENAFDRLVMTFHGLPVRQVKRAGGSHCRARGDCCATAPIEVLKRCYRAQCMRTADAFIAASEIPREKTIVAFQSRFGPGAWLEPSTEHMLRELPAAGHRRVVVIAPSFVTDCLETLEELGVRGRDVFISNGGESFVLVPCVNDSFSTFHI